MLARIFVVVLALSLTHGVCAGPPADPPKEPPGEKGDQPAKKPKKKAKKAKSDDNRALKALKLVIEDADFKKMTFEDFAEWLRRTTKVNVVVRWGPIEKAGVKREDLITLKERGITVKHVLELAFSQLTEDGKKTELAAQADSNTIVISTRADINSRLVTRVYQVQELLIVIPDFVGQMKPAEPGEGRSGGGGTSGRPVTGLTGGGGGGASKGGTGEKEDQETEEDTVKNLIDMITKSIEPETWKVNGGKGTVVSFKGRLVIRNNSEVHQRLAELLGHPGARR